MQQCCILCILMHNIQARLEINKWFMQFLEYCQLDSEVFLWILTKIVEKLRALAGECRDIVRSLIHAVVEGFVVQKFADRTFSRLCVRENFVNTLDRDVESGDSVFRFVVEFVVRQEFSSGAFSLLKVGGY